MTKEQVAALTKLTPRQREMLDFACRGMTDRQIAQRTCSSLAYVTSSLHSIRKKLGVTEEGHRKLVHWYWTEGPGYMELRLAIVSDVLRDSVGVANSIIGKYRQDFEKMSPSKVSKTL